MFFVGKRSFWPRRDFFFIHWVPTILIFLTFSGVTVWSWQQAKERAEEDRREALTLRGDVVQDSLNESLSSHEEVLRAGASLFRTTEDVSRAEWREFTQLFDLQNRYPAIRHIDYIAIISPENLAAHQSQVRSESKALEDYKIFPEGQRAIYSSILYSEPGSLRSNLSKIGFDAYSEPTRQVAINAAVLSGEPAYTDMIEPIDTGDESQPSLGIFFPIVDISANDNASIEQIDGLIMMLVNNQEIFDDLLLEDDRGNFGYKIVNDSETQDSTLYQTANFDSIKESADSQSQTRTIAVKNVKWIIETVSSQQGGTPAIQNRPSDILLAGSLISLFMAAFVYILLVSRTRALAFKEETEIQSAKDELLALASHQLRTPATGVKQYVGMLLQGYGGKLTKDQINLLEKANLSNERQLTTINEMLSVARADAGRLPIEKSDQNLNEIVGDVIEEQKDSIKKRKQKISLHMPKTPIHAKIDPRYMRMAIENLINNASKYTPEKGAIDIRLAKHKHSIELSVSDTGVGIPARHYPMLFKKFSRIPNELTSQVSGTGIGLYLSKYVVEAHGGRLSFSSEAGVGSTFKITLPRSIMRRKQ